MNKMSWAKEATLASSRFWGCAPPTLVLLLGGSPARVRPRQLDPETKGNAGGQVEWGWVKERKELCVGGGSSAPSFIVTSLGNPG